MQRGSVGPATSQPPKPPHTTPSRPTSNPTPPHPQHTTPNPEPPQIIDADSSVARNAEGIPLEVALTRGLGHPNLMTVVTHAFSPAGAAPGGGRSPGGSRSHGGSGGRGGGAESAGRRVCWMVFEFADRGTLAVSARAEEGAAGLFARIVLVQRLTSMHRL